MHGERCDLLQSRVPALRERPVIFYSGASTARPVIYLQEGRQEKPPPPPASPFPASKGPITYHPANAFSSSTYFSVVCILIRLIYCDALFILGLQPGDLV